MSNPLGSYRGHHKLGSYLAMHFTDADKTFYLQVASTTYLAIFSRNSDLFLGVHSY